MIVPNSTIILLKSPIELDSVNQLTFSTKQAQETYFKSLPHIQYDNATYQRKEGVIRFPTSASTVTYEDLLEYNYCMYQNTNYDNKWFYAFINNVTYDNDGMSFIEIETDVFQTWQFDLTYKPSFIEREHVNDDTIGLHTIHEDVETGEYLPIDTHKVSYASEIDTFYCCFGVTELVTSGMSTSGVHFYGGVPSGLIYVVIRNSDILNFLSNYAQAGKNDAINCLFMIPGAFVPHNGSSVTWQTASGIHYCEPSGTTSIKSINISRPNQLGTTTKYTPKNNKMLTKQFNYIMGDNLLGATAPYYYEYFYDPTSCGFTAQGVVTPGCSIKCYPTSYKYTQVSPAVIVDNTSFSEGLVGGKLPIGSWNSDVYTNWLTQNGVNTAINIASDTLQIGSGAMMTASGNATSLSGASNITSGFLGIAGTLGQIYQHSLIPHQLEGNVNSGDITFAVQNSEIRYYRMTIKAEMAKVIDDFFSMYGYQVNSLKTPNITGRQNWNYVKTIGCNILADIPQQDLQKIKDLFNNGITLWHNSNTFLDYSQSNNII